MTIPGPFSKPPAMPTPIAHRATPEKVEQPYRAPRVSQQPMIQNKVTRALVAGILVILVGWSMVALRDRAQAREAGRALAIARIDTDLKACIAEGHRQQVVETAKPSTARAILRRRSSPSRLHRLGRSSGSRSVARRQRQPGSA